MKRQENARSILIVDDEPEILRSFGLLLRSTGFRDILTLEDGRKVLDLLSKRNVALVLLDLTLPHVSGTGLLGGITSEFPGIPVIVVTARKDLETAVECMKLGAFDYLVKPVERSRFEATVNKAFELRALRTEVDSLKEHLLEGKVEEGAAFSSIITQSKKMLAIFQYTEVIAPSDQPVLIIGETGVGKELVARAVHRLSKRTGDFVAVNVAGLDDTMFSDTLFGHRKGAFTGAEKEREGLISKAAGGTLFLDEVGDLPEPSQIKLLRLLQERRYYPLGSDIAKESDSRVVFSTNRDMRELIRTGRFRKDLYYRLCAHQVSIPPLRERKEDIPVLLEHFMGEAAKRLRKRRPTPPPELSTLLSIYHFPGNVRELEGMVFDAVARHSSGVLSMESFRKAIGAERAFPIRTGGGGINLHINESGNFPTMKEAEDYLIKEALRRSGENQGIAATLLGVTRQALNKRLKRKRSS